MKNDNKISKNELTNLVREIVKEVVNGLKENTQRDWNGMKPPTNLYNPKAGVYPAEFKSVPNYIRIKKTNIPGEFMVAWYTNGKFDDNRTYYTHDLADAYDTFKHMRQSVDAANGNVKEQTGTAAVSPVTGPMAFKKKNDPMESLEPLGGMEEKKLDEMTTTMGGTPGYNVPGAFAKKGGSEKGVAGSRALGYELTPIGKQDMQRSADKLLENKKNKK